MPPSFYCKPRWIKAGGRSTGHSLAPSTQIQFMNNQSKKCLSEQHWLHERLFHIRPVDQTWLYMASISRWYLASMILRRSFMVGVISPSSMEKALGSRVNFFTCSNLASSFCRS